MGIYARQKALERLDDRLSVAENLCSALERNARSQELAYIELYDKVRHQMSRMAKRDSLSRKENGEDVVVPDVPEPFPDADPVSRSILMRRAKGTFTK